jgi:3-oxoadipate enol-lactonase / 4-carboxymuconolactone decarboxylase
VPLFQNGPARCFYRIHGHDDKPALFLSHSLGQDHGMWDAQAEWLSPHFRIVRYDTRGHGASGVPAGDYTLDDLGQDALRLADELGIARFAFCGLSLGGMIAQWLAVAAPERVTAVVLANTSARPEAERMEARRKTVLADGMPAVAETVMQRFFSPRLLAARPPAVAESRRTLLATDPVGYAGCCAAIRDMDRVKALGKIRCPVLIVDGDLDVSLSWKGHGDVLADGIPAASVVHLPAAHLSNLECPRAFTAALLHFLLPAGDDTYAAGLQVRRRVLGSAHVDRASASPTSPDFQELITRYAWGAIWTRPGLDLRTRRLLTLGMTAALGRWEEFRLHVRTGLAHELEWCDLEEVLLQAAIYAGVPVANSGFHHAAGERDAASPATPPNK